MGRHVLLAACVTALVMAVGGSANAQDSSHGHTEEHGEIAEHTESAEHEEHAGEEHKEFKNSLGIFLGLTDEAGHDPEGTWGIEYSRDIGSDFGLGAVAEYAGGDLRNTIFIVFGVWNPWKNLELVAGPGVEVHDGRSSDPPHEKSAGEGETDKDATYFVVRVGAAWHLHLSHRIGFAPSLYLDVVDGEKVWVYGFYLAYNF